ncbi:PucR family transcriptional regulator [Paenibacillus glycanilyticus]|uniref:Purine catabolism regulatory protein n=1 Tax=Paenibacillus glycanilyticus TaxID=126569 RepID=A0ABQ6GLH7_9BACL|nr:PucR family transcriptional regulator [Paenibacillus glycanilyticus]GLX70930.1 purine catabolism regulatory protein [Paenibacillus glycanilyticus]
MGVNLLLSELLENGIFEHARVIAGEQGLQRQVQTVNIMDAPDIIRFLRPGELLLTNGYFMKEQPNMFMELMRDMQRMACTGMAVKTERFKLAIPEEALQEADRLRFPIIEISRLELSLGEILQRSTSLIMNNKNDELQYALQIHKQFSEMIMKGKGITGIVDALTKLLSSPILLLNGKLQMIAESKQRHSSMMTALAAAAESVLDGAATPLQPTSFCLVDPSLRNRCHVLLYPVHTYRHEGYLISFHPIEKMSRLFGLTLEQAANVIGMELTKAQAVKERSRRYKNEFFSDLIDGYIASEAEAIHRGKKYGLQTGGTWVLLAARQDGTTWRSGISESQLDRQEERNVAEREELYERIKRQFMLLGHSFVMFTKNDSFGLLLHISTSGWDKVLFIQQLSDLTARMYADYGLSLSIGIGKPVTNALGIRLSYEEAVKALQFGYRLNRSKFVQSYQSKDIGYLFHMLPQEELKQFYEEAFQGLRQMEEAERKELIRTLSAFYDTQCQLMDTSKLLFVHRNTVIYRLDKCEKLLGIKLKDPNESLRLRIALAIEPLLAGSSSTFVK